jgi:hypothetical protein
MPKLPRFRIAPILALLFSLLLTACSPESLFTEEAVPVEPPTTTTAVDGRLTRFFIAFEAAAAERGINVDLAAFGIEATIEELPDEGVAGQCSYGTFIGHQIVIDTDFFNRASDNAREMVVFHELGHCYLQRDHREDSFDNGICRSIMRSGTGDCLDAYRGDTRDYFLDELFELVD